jgi:hypothetical protein
MYLQSPQILGVKYYTYKLLMVKEEIKREIQKNIWDRVKIKAHYINIETQPKQCLE